MARITSNPMKIVINPQASGFTPPYAAYLPASGQVTQLPATYNNPLQIKNPGFPDWSGDVHIAMFYGYGAGVYAKTYGTQGGFVVAGTGGHGAGGIWGGFVWDVATGNWVARPNGNNFTETIADLDSSAAGPFNIGTYGGTIKASSYPSVTGDLPAPSHGYLIEVCPPKTVGPSSNYGYMVRPHTAAYGNGGRDSHRAYKMNLETGVWSAAMGTEPAWGASASTCVDTHCAYDTVTNRIYTTFNNGDTSHLYFMTPNGSTEGWQWNSVPCDVKNVLTRGMMTIDVERRLLIFTTQDVNTQSYPRIWYLIDITNDTEIAKGARLMNITESIAGEDNNSELNYRFIKYPVDNCFYMYNGRAVRYQGDYNLTAGHWGPPQSWAAIRQWMYKLTPPASSYITGPWTLTKTATFSGTAQGIWQSEWGNHSSIYGNFFYIDALSCFGYFPRGDYPMCLIKP